MATNTKVWQVCAPELTLTSVLKFQTCMATLTEQIYTCTCRYAEFIYMCTARKNLNYFLFIHYYTSTHTHGTFRVRVYTSKLGRESDQYLSPLPQLAPLVTTHVHVCTCMKYDMHTCTVQLYLRGGENVEAGTTVVVHTRGGPHTYIYMAHTSSVLNGNFQPRYSVLTLVPPLFTPYLLHIQKHRRTHTFPYTHTHTHTHTHTCTHTYRVAVEA